MTEYTIGTGRCHSTKYASLAAVGVFIQQRDMLRPLRDMVKVPQKTIKYTPTEKLRDALIAILAGAHGLKEINDRVRSEPPVQRAFGRTACADQSVVQDTLDACTTETVTQMQQAVDTIYRRHSAGYRHDYAHNWQLLDVDLTGLPCGPKAAMATKGYFGQQRSRRGRQLARVAATHYHEVVVDQLYPGKDSLTKAFRPVVMAAEQTLELDEAKRSRTILRLDAGAGSVADINWALDRGYQVHGKDYSGNRAPVLARSVTEWVSDPRVRGREAGWVTQPATEYHRPARRIAVRCQRKDGRWAVGVIVSFLAPEDVLALMKMPAERIHDDQAVLWAYVYFYDQRGGGVETTIKDDKQGLGMTKRNKKRAPAQQMVMLLGVLAHNILVWVRRVLAVAVPKLAHYGLLRLVRDVLHVNGLVVHDEDGRIVQITLNQLAPLTRALAPPLHALLAPANVVVISGEI